MESVTRSQKLEVSMGSRKRAKRCHCGIEGLELRGGHGGVFGGVEAAAELEGHVAEALKQREGDAGLDGKVEREHDAGLGKAHHAERGDVAEGFEHGEEAGEAGVGDLAQDGDGAFLGACSHGMAYWNWTRPRLP